MVGVGWVGGWVVMCVWWWCVCLCVCMCVWGGGLVALASCVAVALALTGLPSPLDSLRPLPPQESAGGGPVAEVVDGELQLTEQGLAEVLGGDSAALRSACANGGSGSGEGLPAGGVAHLAQRAVQRLARCAAGGSADAQAAQQAQQLDGAAGGSWRELLEALQQQAFLVSGRGRAGWLSIIWAELRRWACHGSRRTRRAQRCRCNNACVASRRCATPLPAQTSLLLRLRAALEARAPSPQQDTATVRSFVDSLALVSLQGTCMEPALGLGAVGCPANARAWPARRLAPESESGDGEGRERDTSGGRTSPQCCSAYWLASAAAVAALVNVHP